MKRKKIDQMSCDELDLALWKAENKSEKEAEKVWQKQVEKGCQP